MHDRFTSMISDDLTGYPDFSHDEYEPYHAFLDKWGTAYVSSVIEGGAIEIAMSESRSNSSGSDSDIKSTVSASYLAFATMNFPEIAATIKQSLSNRDGYLSLLISGGSSEARAALQQRFDIVMNNNLHPLDFSRLVPNATAIWSKSVESGDSVYTKG